MDELDMERAACITADPELFFQGDKDSVATAKSYCGLCPIVLQCLTYALTNEEYGVWGGTTLAERQAALASPEARKQLIISVTS